MRRMLIFTVAAAVPVAALAAEPAYEFEFRRSDERAAVVREKGRTVFVVTCPTGIGGVTVTRGDEPWPERVVLRLRYAPDRGFRYLEHVTLRTDRLLATGDLKSSGRMPFRFLGDDEKPERVEADESHGTLDVKAVTGDEWLELTLPSHMLRDSRTLAVSWIDAYRN